MMIFTNLDPVKIFKVVSFYKLKHTIHTNKLKACRCVALINHTIVQSLVFVLPLLDIHNTSK